ncbi:Swt1 family HEPN domain-containing protein [Runella salmonicolor]|uniref:Swt1 family HEPN domain-containing protein n=1 Tax=Runella salmonicolor TaxID=2950278 RepID=A0ABT1FZX4_9BACT|nr:Swt1 family HEPN domain-containing protein [Runella salmonicolor]MCP1386253.1 Swt1 family HEPN domain-containing protein [Runella salmonicolor]
MQENITSFQREQLEKALKLFIEAFRDYIVEILSREYGEADWAVKYKAALKPEHQLNWEREKAKGRSARDMIDYTHLRNFALQFKHSAALKADFQEDVHVLPTRLSDIYYKIRNRIRHDEETIPKDDYIQFWLHLRAIARAIKNPSLIEALKTLENDDAMKHTTTEVPTRLAEVSPAETPTGRHNEYALQKQIVEVPRASLFLPILVRGQKAHVVHLCEADVVNNRPVRGFIFEQSGHSITLFSLIENTYQGRDTTHAKGKCQLKEVRVEDKTLTVVLEQNEVSPQPNINAPQGIKALYRQESLVVECSVEMAFDKIVFQLWVNDKSYTGEIQTHFAPPQLISDVAMDFGSEASQIVVHTRGRGETLRRFPLLKEMQEQFYKELQGPFHQEDTSEKERLDTEKGFFRSQIFIRQKDAVFFKQTQPNAHQANDLVCTLTKKGDIDNLRKTHFLIANPKLAHLGAYGNFEIQFKDTSSNELGSQKNDFGELVTDIQQAIIYHFLHTILGRLDLHAGKTHSRFINIKFLVPNVLDQAAVSNLITQTYQFLRQPQIADIYRIRGIEVGTLSESDASFLGCWQDEAIRKANAKYLIIDVGKGTTDFSIIESNAQMELSSTYRSGFIGAGNVLTYAFIETVVSAFLGEQATDVLRQKLLRIMTSAFTDIVNQNTFLDIIEGLKQNYRFKGIKPLSALLTAEKREEVVNLVIKSDASSNVLNKINEALEDALKNHKSIADEFGFINNAVQAVADEINQKVAKALHDPTGEKLPNYFHKVILTGRGFLFEPLVAAIRQTFSQTLLPFHTADELKRICLRGAFSGRVINYDSNLVGMPRLHTLLYQKATSQAKPQEIINDGQKTSVYTPSDGISEMIHQFKFPNWFGDSKPITKDSDEPAPLAVEKEKIPPPSTSPLLRFLAEGNPIAGTQYRASQHTIGVSGVKYLCEGYNGPLDLMFDGERIWMRTDGGLKALQVPLDFFGGQSMVWKTLFPYFNATAKEHTPIDHSQPDPDDVI